MGKFDCIFNVKLYHYFIMIVFSFIAEETNVARGKVIKSQRKHARRRPGVIHYRHTHFFIRLREGKPPKHYYPPPETGYEKMENYIKTQRNRRIILSL